MLADFLSGTGIALSAEEEDVLLMLQTFSSDGLKFPEREG